MAMKSKYIMIKFSLLWTCVQLNEMKSINKTTTTTWTLRNTFVYKHQIIWGDFPVYDITINLQGKHKNILGSIIKDELG